MPKARSPDREKAFAIYRQHGGKIELVDIATQLNLSAGTVRGWKNKDAWDTKLNGTFQSDTERSKRAKGGQPGNDNAVGHGAPEGNLNAIKHGAYQNIYTEFLPDDERAIYEEMPGGTDLESEIKLLRLKIARLTNRQMTFFYDMFGVKHEKELSNEDRESGILACTKQLEKLIRTQEQNKMQREKLELDKAKQGASANENELADKLRGLINELDS